MTNEQLDALQHWLDAKWRRHGEIEDKQSAEALAELRTTAEALRKDAERLNTVIRAVRGLYQVTHIHAAIDAAITGQAEQEKSHEQKRNG